MNANYCTGYFYVPDFYTSAKPRMFKLSFKAYYLTSDDNEALLTDGVTETTLDGFEQFIFELDSSQYTYTNTGLVIDTTKEEYKNISDIICIQHDSTHGLFRDISMYMTPKEGSPHMILRGVNIDGG